MVLKQINNQVVSIKCKINDLRPEIEIFSSFERRMTEKVKLFSFKSFVFSWSLSSHAWTCLIDCVVHSPAVAAARAPVGARFLVVCVEGLFFPLLCGACRHH